MQSRKAIIIDFDGTVADSFDIFIEALVAATKRRKPLTANEIKSLRNSSSTKEIIKKLGIKPWQMPLVITRGRHEIKTRMNKVTVFAGMPEVLKEISAEYTIYILSTNSKENVAEFLKKYGLIDFVRKVYGDIGILRKHKSLKKLLDNENLAATACLYIGDETRDIEAARKADLKCVAVEWGYSNPEALRLHSPDALVSKPYDLPKTVRMLI